MTVRTQTSGDERSQSRKQSVHSLLLVFAIVVATGIAPHVHATVHELNPGESIQQVVNFAQDGDTLLLHDGVYDETVVLIERTLIIASRYLLNYDTAHVFGTIITPDFMRADTGSCLVVASTQAARVRLIGLTFSGGLGTVWGATNDRAGGALCIMGSASIEKCIIQNSSAPRGGGIAISRAEVGMLPDIQLRECIIQQCHADLYGGGLWAQYCTLDVRVSVFADNETPYLGAAADILLSFLIIDSCVIRNNAGQSSGIFSDLCSGRITNSLFDGNGRSRDVLDSHLNCSGEGMTISRNIFRNSAPGGISIFLYSPPGSQLLPRFYGNVVENNSSGELSGTIGVFNANGELAYNLIRNNLNIAGGAVYVTDGSDVRIHHNWFEGNRSILPHGGSVLVTTARSGPSLDSNVIMNNVGNVITCPDTRWQCLIIDARNNWWGDASGPYHPTLNPTGRGDTLRSDSVLFIPWLTEPPDTTMPSSSGRNPRPAISATWELAAVYPNPFNSDVRLIIAGFTRSDFRLTLHNLLGQEVDVIHRGPLTGGELLYRAPPRLASGVYFIHAAGGGVAETRKVALIR